MCLKWNYTFILLFQLSYAVSDLEISLSNITLPKKRQFSAASHTYETDTLMQVGDILYPRDPLYYDNHDPHFRSLRPGYHWPEVDGVRLVRYRFSPYKNGTEIHETVRELVEYAIDHIEERTCIRFKKITPEEATNDTNFISIYDNGEHCLSYLGMMPTHMYKESHKWGLGQGLIINPHCGDYVAIHELLHALGFFHTMVRLDRNDHLVILNESITNLDQFKIEKNQVYFANEIPFDLSSIMHYTAFEMNVPRQITMLTKDPRFQFLIGVNLEGMSHLDKYLANKLYNCVVKWEKSCKTQLVCKNFGYINKDCQCSCPPGTRGSECEETFTKHGYPFYYYDYIPDCFMQVNSSMVIRSKGSEWRGDPPEKIIPRNTECIIEIDVPLNQEIQMKFNRFNIFDPSSFPCADYLIIRNSSDHHVLGCGRKLENSTLYSKQSVYMYYKIRSPYAREIEIDVTYSDITNPPQEIVTSPQEIVTSPKVTSPSSRTSETLSTVTHTVVTMADEFINPVEEDIPDLDNEGCQNICNAKILFALWLYLRYNNNW